VTANLIKESACTSKSREMTILQRQKWDRQKWIEIVESYRALLLLEINPCDAMPILWFEMGHSESVIDVEPRQCSNLSWGIHSSVYRSPPSVRHFLHNSEILLSFLLQPIHSPL
jgi:hypothetical protein